MATSEGRLPWTAQVEEALGLFDQPLSGRQLMDLTGANVNQMSATLHNLQKYGVIDAVNVQDEPFWFLTGEDTRTHHVKLGHAGTKVRKPGYVSKKRPAGTLVKKGKRQAPAATNRLDPYRDGGGFI